MTFEELIKEYWEWAEKTFDTSAKNSVKGLIREAKELENELLLNGNFKNTSEIIEIADVFFYTMYILLKKGYTVEEFLEVAKLKCDINKARTWKKDETGCFSHVK